MAQVIIEGTVHGYGTQRSGQGQNGPWYDQPIIIMQFGQYPEPVAVSFTKVDLINQALTEFPLGTNVRVSVNLKSTQGKEGGWFTNIRAYKIEAYQAPTQQYQQQPAAPAAAPAALPPSSPAPQPQYQVGQVMNGHQLHADGKWYPVQAAAPAPAAAHVQQPAPVPQQPALQQPAAQAPQPNFFGAPPAEGDLPF